VSRESVKKHLLERDALAELVIARDVAQNNVPVVLPEDTLHQANMLIQALHCHEVFVVDSRDGRRLLGVLHKEDLTDAYHKEIVKQAAGETFAHSINMPRQVETVDVMDGYGIIELETPHAFSGKLLRELDLRNRFGITVLAIKRVSSGGGTPRTRMWVPESADRFQDGDVMVLMGEHVKIAEFQRRH
jgi:K+/H+ antiporter YhaU regulatory subunit KhtT